MVRNGLTIARVSAIAAGAPAALPDDALTRLRAAHRRGLELVATHPAYGRSTGVGANRSVEVEGLSGHGMRLLRSHAADTGDALPDPVVRAMLAVRLNQLYQARSGIDPVVVEGLLRMVNTDALPEVRSSGSIGTADLPALAATALALVGERPTKHPFDPIPAFGADSALPFMSSSALTIARGMLAIHAWDRLDRAGRMVTALSALAVDANAQAFSIPAADAARSPGVPRVAAELRALLGTPGPAARIQDPFGIRVAIHTQGAALAARDALADRLEAAASAGQENPLFTDDEVVHHGGFYQVALALAIDGMNLAVAQAGSMSMSRLRMLAEPAYTGLAPFLAVGPPGSSGLMVTEFTAAAALADLRDAASPVTLGAVVLSRGNEDGASFASQGVVHLERAIRAHRTMVSVEFLAASRAVAQRGLRAPTAALSEALVIGRDLVADLVDGDLRPPLGRADELLDVLGDVAPDIETETIEICDDSNG